MTPPPLSSSRRRGLNPGPVVFCCALGALLVLVTACKEEEQPPFSIPPGNTPGGGQTSKGDAGTDGGVASGGFDGSFPGKPCTAGASSCQGACPDGGSICLSGCGFLRPVEYGLTGAEALAAGDLDGDGYVDLATVNSFDNTAAVMLNRGGGVFSTALVLPTGNNPSALVLEDFNGDGRKDLVVANKGAGTLGVYLGRGDGTFQAPSTADAGVSPEGLASAQLDALLGNDVVVLRGGITPGVAVLKGSGGGLFESGAAYELPSFVDSLVAADLNTDGKLDVAITFPSTCEPARPECASVGVLLGNGDGTFQSPRFSPAGSTPRGLVVGDLNYDLRPDLVVSNAESSGTVSVLRGNGDGSFLAPVAYEVGSYPEALALVDVDRSGQADLLVANRNDSRVSVLLGSADGTFAPQVPLLAFPTGVGLRSLSVVDFDKDNAQDLAVATGAGIRMLWGVCQ